MCVWLQVVWDGGPAAGGLRATGAGTTVRFCTAQEIVDATRVAYDPTVALQVERARGDGGTGLTWDDAGPALHEAEFDHYRHDRAWSHKPQR